MTIDGFGLQWQLSFEFADEDWYEQKATLSALVAALGDTAWWRELDVLGHDGKPGKPIGSVAAASKVIASAKTGVFVLARGEPRAAVWIDETEISISIDVMPEQLDLTLRARDGALRRLGKAAIDDVIDALPAMRRKWKPMPTLLAGSTAPFGHERIVYKRIRPPRRSTGSPVEAVVDLVEPDSPLASARLPAGVTRCERDGLVILRWIDDSTDPAKVSAAGGRHEAWIASLIETDVHADWNEQGDQYVETGRRSACPPLRLIDKENNGYLDVPAAKGKLDPVAWKQAAELARRRKLPDGTELAEVRIIVPTRAIAVAQLTAARTAGIARVLYETDNGFWDPDPPGDWFTPQELVALQPGKSAGTKARHGGG